MADLIARFGFNAVRLHHMDARDIWGGPKLVGGSVNLENEMTYTVSFWAKADKKQDIDA